MQEVSLSVAKLGLEPRPSRLFLPNFFRILAPLLRWISSALLDGH